MGEKRKGENLQQETPSQDQGVRPFPSAPELTARPKEPTDLSSGSSAHTHPTGPGPGIPA